MPTSYLKKYWGFDSFRPPQEEIIQSVLNGQDVLVMMPTGGGKSICYQVPALMKTGCCLVISPLVALMHDQVENLKNRGISAIYLHSGMSKTELKREYENIRNGKYKLAYTSPERLLSQTFKDHLPYLNLSFLAIDEAHCISQWGHDFRPAYREIGSLREQLPNLNVIALTASATPQVQDDVLEQLRMLDAQVFRTTFARNNLIYRVRETDDTRGVILDLCLQVAGSGLIYAPTRSACEKLCMWLRDEGVDCSFYHAGLPAEVRNQRQLDWISNRIRVLTCTNAFGMGVDKPDVRFVAHWGPPNSLEAYYQEAGRAGRDGQRSVCELVIGPSDRSKGELNVATQHPRLDRVNEIYEAMSNYLGIAIHSGEGHQYDLDLPDFCKKFDYNPLDVFYALQAAEQLGYISRSEAVVEPSRVRFITDSTTLYDFQLRYPRYEQLIKFMLRRYAGIMDRATVISESELAKAVHANRKDIHKVLNQFEKIRLIEYHEQTDLPKVRYVHGRTQAIIDPDQRLKTLGDTAFSKWKSVVHYVDSEQCRMQAISSYFGEDLKEECGQCDICNLRKRNAFSSSLYQEIRQKVEFLLSQSPHSIRAILEELREVDRDELSMVLRWMMDDRVIRMREDHKLRLR
ncbi:MAG: RecQ family ATP-dependent DNA helicase [Flavobacteriales bacterium]|nr:RecQ family ATP-dependent DNA helicase [Bacteroidota bacterium]MCB9241703.1 RecQ family ATP-dependent DNA helicase [Flavobacteriales bacterium]